MVANGFHHGNPLHDVERLTAVNFKVTLVWALETQSNC